MNENPDQLTQFQVNDIIERFESSSYENDFTVCTKWYVCLVYTVKNEDYRQHPRYTVINLERMTVARENRTFEECVGAGHSYLVTEPLRAVKVGNLREPESLRGETKVALRKLIELRLQTSKDRIKAEFEVFEKWENNLAALDGREVEPSDERKLTIGEL